MPTTNLSGRIALVTGSSRGIGAAIARRLAADGAAVVVHYNTNRAPADALASEIVGRGGRARVVQAELGTPDGLSALVRDAAAAFGALDILVNNAGTFQGSTLDTLDAATIDRVLAVNVRAVLLATREYAAVTRSTAGRVVNISSIASIAPAPSGSLYASSKAAVDALTRGHALELAPRGITVNAVAPGPTETDMFDAGFPPDAKTIVARNTALGRLGHPEDIARVVGLLCSDDAAWITGQVIGANGGMVTGAINLIRIARSVGAS